MNWKVLVNTELSKSTENTKEENILLKYQKLKYSLWIEKYSL